MATPNITLLLGELLGKLHQRLARGLGEVLGVGGGRDGGHRGLLVVLGLVVVLCSAKPPL